MNKKQFKAVDGPIIMLIAFAAMLAMQLVMSFVLIGAGAIEGVAYEILNCVGMILFQLVYLTVYLVYTRKRKIVSDFSPKNKISLFGVLVSIALTFIAFFGFIGLAYYFEYLLGGIGYVGATLDVSTPIGIALLVVATVVAAPIGEETIFRSALCSGLSKSRKDDVGICLISGLCFAFMHINPSQTVYQFCLGAVAAYVMIKGKSVIYAIIMHALSNALALFMSFTRIGVVVDGFYAQTGENIWITLLTCVALPIVAVTIIWLVAKYFKKYETKRLPHKYKGAPKVIWIDEVTKEPIFEGESVPTITEQNRVFQKGFNPYTGEPVMVDRLELQNALREEYNQNNNEKSGVFGKNTYKVAFCVYFVITAFMWLLTFLAGFIVY
ncbi:MAG: CPBP family intramembrane metalloprotease [Clostridia bacterium]|nr:CPBP family intramembrane metalloprotease [Clostridia bacterium]